MEKCQSKFSKNGSVKKRNDTSGSTLVVSLITLFGTVVSALRCITNQANTHSGITEKKTRNDHSAHVEFSWGVNNCPQVFEANANLLVHVCIHVHRCAASQTNTYAETFQMAEQIVLC